MKSIDQAELNGKTALVRVDFNVPMNKNQEITDDKRIREALPTITYILENGGSVVLMSHLGRPKGEVKPEFSLKPVAERLEKLLDRKVVFIDENTGKFVAATCSNLEPGSVVLIENLRFHPGETKGDVAFAEELSKLGDLYVNDAFGTAHRAHASTAVIAQFFEEKYAGFLLLKEIETANKILTGAERPFTAIMGGAKVSDKIPIIQRLLDKVDYILIGGGMAYTFHKAQGFQIGTSLLEEDKVIMAAALLKEARRKNVTILTPVDSVAADKFSEDANTGIYRTKDFPKDMMGLDIGPDTFKHFYSVIMKSKTILWNGPMGVFEMEPFAQGTVAMAQAVVEATKNGAFSLIGGGDSAAAIKQQGLENEVSYVSTGGGALLEYLEGKVLPGVEALG